MQLPLLLLFLFLLALASPALARRHAPPDTTTTTETLDVAASLSLARAALVSTADQLLHHSSLATATTTTSETFNGDLTGNNNNRLTLHLHSRDFLPTRTFRPSSSMAPRHATYESLIHARLRRDAARAAAVSARASLSSEGLTISSAGGLIPSDQTPIFSASAASAAALLQGPVVSGVGQGSGEYFSRIGIGSPARQLYMVLDTGSDVTWLQCAPCADCYAQSDPLFDPALSSSYATVPCDSPHCRALDASACHNNAANGNSSCVYEVAYGDGSYTVGDFATETLTLGGDGSAAVHDVAIGCGHDNEGLFVGAAGLLALGGGPLSFPSQISATEFSYCLVDRDSPSASTLQFGASDSSTVTAPLMRSPRSNTFYYVALNGISVGGETLSDIPPAAFAMDEQGSGGVIVDSGTAVTRLQSSAYSALRDAFVRGTQALPRASGVSLFDTCYDLAGRSSVQVPAVSLRFEGGGELKLPAKNYLIPVDGAGTYCLAFAATGGAVSIVGNVQQQGIRVSFDTAKNTVGFSPNKC
ncbi:protein ASPARTIC PROTEASE IN GUARD CELL 1 [Brachypodium distachyon]|uniref:Peptidase A1 domain-containing protein n=1 Tax=Brachypodium distachyon TaxID=15368 RepID=I1HBU7_BRADI|nr:protein ASPARTIC PROTEASE IN GUARD CELL 1 [Brachypodium distachyon]KQK02610.1 hypothetical protein BRADI_2g02660v3 [Brachypodium distachyon]PNT69905.1 hypothetical protein BRADI_2g02660v3 [Brachypodium distachyon]|eukprot:XP_003565317.2 protein ASPARTIC PROTEASE IN GUARD CELL 1 [Brachypodium distachyon]